MKSEGLARRYARALLEAAGPNAAAVDDTLATVAAVLTAEPYRRWFLHPAVSEEAKRDALAAVLGAGEEPVEQALVRRLLFVLMAHRRQAWLLEVAEAFHQERLAAEGLTEAVVQTARPLPEATRQRLLAGIARFVQRRLAARFETVPEILGGVRVRFADRLLDASALGELVGLKHQLLGNESR